MKENDIILHQISAKALLRIQDYESSFAMQNVIKELKKKGTDEVLISKEDLVQLSKDAFIDPCTGGNPRKTSEEDIFALYNIAY